MTQNMTPTEAEKIINEYGTALDYGVDGIARPLSRLSVSKARIRFAFFVVISEKVKNGTFTEEDRQVLVTAYSFLDSFVDDKRVALLNMIHGQVAQEVEVKGATPFDSPEKEYYKSFVLRAYGDTASMGEIIDFIKECEATDK